MKRTTGFLVSLLLSIAMLAAVSADAYAARMGGGRSFGSRPSFNTPYQRSPSPSSPGASRSGASGQPAGLSAAQQRNQGLRDTLAQRGGMGRFLGGLALGGLLGALFMGGGFEGINFFDILIFGGIAFLLFKLLAARRQSAERVATPGGGYLGAGRPEDADAVYRRQTSGAGFETDILSHKGAVSSGGAGESIPVPADFDAPAFLSGARSAYEMMQKAWDQGALTELRALTTDKVFSELQDQIHARGGVANQTDLLKIDLELLEVRDAGANREATVLFDVLMREEPGARPAQVREVWHFIRPHASRQPTWFLDGIQQLED